MRSTRTSLAAALATTLAAGVLLAGCSGASDSTDSADPGSSSSTASASPTGSPGTASASATPYLPVPDGVELTAQGSELEVGDEAVVAYEPRQDRVGVLGIRVDRLERTTFKQSFRGWQLDKATRRTNPYFVRATVTNEGQTDLGGRPVPLYIVDGENTLVEASSFASRFEPCPSTPLPKKFAAGDRTKVCLVFLSPDRGELTAVSFRPTQEFNPITWTGELEKVEKPRAKKRGGNKRGAKQG